MKIIFSRKGFDGTAGGSPSPIIGNRPYSFPIPSSNPSDLTYGDLQNGIGELLEDLTGKKPIDNCHFDPDLDATALQRMPGWRGAFGQVSGAQGHLEKQKVDVGDLFLFWGWFKHAEKLNTEWKYVGKDEHRIFGWLQIGDVLTVGNSPDNALLKYPWLKDHPHAQAGRDLSASNTIYVANPWLQVSDHDFGLPGWGLFAKGFRLTLDGALRSRWKVPDWLNPKRGGVGMSGSCKMESTRWHSDGYLNVGPGQEFVADIASRSDAIEWLKALFQDAVQIP